MNLGLIFFVKPIRPFFTFILIALFISSISIYGQITLYASKDAYCEALNGNANYNNQNLKIGVTSSPLNQYFAGLYFDLPSISSNNVISAQLKVTKQSGSGIQTVTYILPLNSDWSETQFTGNWLNSNASFTILGTVSNLSGDISIDITSIFKSWLNNPSSYHGIVFYPQNSGSVTTFTFYDHEHGNCDSKPYILIKTNTADLYWTQNTILNTARIRARAESYNGQIFCIGGQNGSNGSALNTIEYYLNCNWSNLASQLSVPRFEFTSCVLNNKIYVFGGQDKSNITDVVESYDGSIWLPAGVMPIHLYDLDGAVYNNEFYIFGGLTSLSTPYTYDTYVRKFNNSTGWTTLSEIPSTSSTTFSQRSGYSCVALNNYVYVIGGANALDAHSVNYLNEVWRFDPTTNTWLKMAPMKAKRADFACLALGTKIYAIGGTSTDLPNPSLSIEVFTPDDQIGSWSNLTYFPTVAIERPAYTIQNNCIYLLGLGSNYTSCYSSNPIVVTGIETFQSTIDEFRTFQNYPNPFNPSTKIIYELPEAIHVTIKIYDILGREIKTLINQYQNQGSHEIIWQGDDNTGKKAASGVYIYQLYTNKYSQAKKMILLK